MDSLISKWTSMLTEASSGALTILGVSAVVAIIVFCIIGVFSDDMGRKRTVNTLVVVALLCAIAACAAGIVQWALA